jgi:hypothetical protein
MGATLIGWPFCESWFRDIYLVFFSDFHLDQVPMLVFSECQVIARRDRDTRRPRTTYKRT